MSRASDLQLSSLDELTAGPSGVDVFGYPVPSYYSGRVFNMPSRSLGPSRTVHFSRDGKSGRRSVATQTASRKQSVSRKVRKLFDRTIVRPTPYADGGRNFGRAVGSAFGLGELGEYVGKHFGSAIGTLLGSGDYTGNAGQLSANSIVRPRAIDVPNIRSGKYAHGVTIRKREFIGDIISNANANTSTLQQFIINPTILSTFPWLATVANSFEQYVINGMIFEFKSMSSDSLVSAQTNLGFVAMATVYDALDVAFTTKQELENYEFSQSAKPSRNQIHGIECKRSQNVLTELYVRPAGGLPPNSDQRFYDFGVFNIMTQAPGTSVNLGELWVSYDITLLKSKLPLTPSGDVQSLHISRQAPINTTILNNGGATSTIADNGNLFAAVTVNNATTLTLAGLNTGTSFLVTYLWTSTTAITGQPSFSVTGTLRSLWTNNAGLIDINNNVISPDVAIVTAKAFQASFVITPAATPAGSSNGVISLVTTPGALTSGVFGLDIFIASIDNSLVF